MGAYRYFVGPTKTICPNCKADADRSRGSDFCIVCHWPKRMYWSHAKWSKWYWRFWHGVTKPMKRSYGAAKAW